MTDTQEKPPLEFKEKSKKEIYSANLQKIEDRFRWVTKFTEMDRPRIIFGAVFETLAVSEIGINRVETVKQTAVRQIVEELFQKAEYVLDTYMPSKPDFVSIVFDDKGQLVIDEIIEIKSTSKSVREGIGKHQPEHTLTTIKNIVKLINSLITSGDSTLETWNLPKNNKNYGKEFLKKVLNEIKDLQLSDELTFSPRLNYHVITLSGENVPPTMSVQNLDGQRIELISTQSMFTKEDIHSIIDHHQETP